MTDKQTPQLSAVFARAEKLRPRVEQPDNPWTVPLGIAGAAALGLMVFAGMSAGREARAQQPQPPAVQPRPVAPTPAPPPSPAPAPPPAPTTLAPPSALVPSDPNESHWRAPAMVVDLSQNAGASAAVAAQAAAPGAIPGVVATTVAPRSSEELRSAADERFAARVIGSQSDTARAYQLRDLGRTVPQGAVIPAVLETAIDSDLPGSVRAVVSRDVKSFDGSVVLIQRGSKLIGQYKSAAAVGQTRAFVVWSRMISPNGVSIDIGSPAADRLGRGGLEGEVDTHFFRRFGAAILLSVVSAGAQALANSASSNNNTLVIASPTQANNVASIALQKQIEIPDTIRVAQGTPVQVFVARDLDFAGVYR